MSLWNCCCFLVPLFFSVIFARQDSYVFRIRTVDPTSPLDSQILRQDDSTGLIATPSSTLTSSPPWLFTLAEDLSTHQGYEFTNNTAEMIVLGRKFYMWDPEPARLTMVLPPKAVAKTGYPGSSWPSVYITARWYFNITYAVDDTMFLEHGFNHGGWWTEPDSQDGGKWKVYWWNGTTNAEVHTDKNVQLRGIEVVPWESVK